MTKYKQKPVIVTAAQWFPGLHIDGVAYMDGVAIYGKYILTPGDWIVAGESRPYSTSQFLCKYEVLDES